MGWLIPEYLSSEMGLSPRQRRAIHRDAWRLWGRDWRNVCLYLSLPVVYGLAVPFASDVGGAMMYAIGLSGWPYVAVRVAAPITWAVIWFLIGGAVLHRWRFAPCVYRAARMNGLNVCESCGYWLKGLGKGVKECPECGIQYKRQQNHQN